MADDQDEVLGGELPRGPLRIAGLVVVLVAVAVVALWVLARSHDGKPEAAPSSSSSAPTTPSSSRSSSAPPTLVEGSDTGLLTETTQRHATFTLQVVNVSSSVVDIRYTARTAPVRLAPLGSVPIVRKHVGIGVTATFQLEFGATDCVHRWKAPAPVVLETRPVGQQAWRTVRLDEVEFMDKPWNVAVLDGACGR